MKIALVVHDLREYGGHSLYTKVLANELSQRHEVAVFANTFERPANARWTSHHVRASRGSALACVQTFPLGLRSHAQALSKYEIRHSQGYCGGTPNVVTAHICVAAYRDSLREVSLGHRISLRLMAAAEERFYRSHKGRVIAVSMKIAGELQQWYGVNPNSISVIPHGVDPARFNLRNRTLHREAMRRQLGIAANQVTALYVGDLTKAHAYLKELSVAAPEVQFINVTSSTAYHWRRENVRFYSSTPQLEPYYAAADAFVFPTTYDSFGMVALEAMSSGLPVFCSDNAGAAELIVSGKDGFVTPLNEWVETTAAHLGDQEPLERIGIAAAETASQHGWCSVVNAVEQLYREVAAA
jgi:glycosyltransferase involved in cell wall biosynthesis